ncbi:hypothetical protein LZG00_08525 [Rhodobacteraceae bacterium LMO-12]|nr:hypothetical protein [Rhodobacteraceae bacterium LMO-JJ12]
MIRTALIAGLIGLSTPAFAESLTLRTVDFKLPLGIAEKIPSSIKPSDIFVSSDNCYYVRKDLSFVWIDCVG